MKRVMTLFLILVCGLGFTACNSDKHEHIKDNNNSSSKEFSMPEPESYEFDVQYIRIKL